MAQGRAEEFKIQAECAQWLWNEHPETRRCFILVDNNADSAIAALQKRSMGMVRGAADTLFYWKQKLYFIEFKTPKGKQSDWQIRFEAVAQKHSHGYFIVRSFDQFKKLIEAILSS